MAESTARAQGNTQEIAQDEWAIFLTEFTRENRGAHARVEVLGGDVGYQVETEDRPFDGISVDYKDGEHSVWILFGTTVAGHFTHGVHNVTAIRVKPPGGLAGAALEIEAKDGTKTLLELSLPEEYALPPASSPA